MRHILLSEIPHITHTSFDPYGNIIGGIDCKDSSDIISSLSLPLQTNEYSASVDALEHTLEYHVLAMEVFGDIPVQAGYCNGLLSTLNALEYHKSSEVILAVTDMVLIVGCAHDIHHRTYHTSQAECFFVPSTTLLELFPLTLHFAPCNVQGSAGFRSMIMLPRGTNNILSKEAKDPLLFRKNKWLLAHDSATRFITEGAAAALVGDNIEIVIE